MNEEIIIRYMNKVCRALGNIKSDIEMLKKWLVPNGDPEKTLPNRLARLEESVNIYQAASQQQREKLNKNGKVKTHGKTVIICTLITSVTSIIIALIAILK